MVYSQEVLVKNTKTYFYYIEYTQTFVKMLDTARGLHPQNAAGRRLNTELINSQSSLFYFSF